MDWFGRPKYSGVSFAQIKSINFKASPLKIPVGLKKRTWQDDSKVPLILGSSLCYSKGLGAT